MLALALLLLVQYRLLDGMPVTHLPTDPTSDACGGCFYESKCYADGEDISRGDDGSNWCFGLMCIDSSPIAWDDWNCGTTSPPSTSPTKTSMQPSPSTSEQTTTTELPTTTAPPPISTTPIYPTTRVGCFQNGEWYQPGSEINQGSDGKGWCYGTICTADGQVVSWDNWNCAPSTTEPPSPDTTAASSTPSATSSTQAPSPTTVPIPLGCLQNGAWYEPDSEISRESDGEGWCHGISCDSDGKIVAWDDWNCAATEDPLLEKPQPTTEPKGCYYANQWHPHGNIFEGSDGNGCRYGAICGIDGQVTRWDEFNCQSTKRKSD